MPNMNMSLKVVMGIALLLIITPFPMRAQSQTRLVYYEDENPRSLDHVLLRFNICLEVVLRLNPDLNIHHIEYGTQFVVPVAEPCYLYDQNGSSYNSPVPRLKYYENGEWLAKPYYSDEVVYMNPAPVETLAAKHNICVDDLLAENILLQDFDRYNMFATGTTFDIFIPEKALACDLDWVEPFPPQNRWREIQLLPSQVLPDFLATYHNVCPEEISGGWGLLYGRPAQSEIVTMNVPADAPPCYNEAGQRLIYFDEQGRPLDEPQYSSLPVYQAAPGETIHMVAVKHGVCFIDLLLINNFPDMPAVNGLIELFIPPARPCPDDVMARLVGNRDQDLTSISLELNVCPEDLLPLNPHLKSSWEGEWYLRSGVYRSENLARWILTPVDSKLCYWEYKPQIGVSIYDLERELNICYQSFIWEKYRKPARIIRDERAVLYIRRDAPSCYNEAGQRRYYTSADTLKLEEQMQRLEPPYSDMALHNFQPSDTVYSISQQYNVCVEEILAVNPRLVSARPAGYPMFIPHTRPCYDESTRLPLIYEDENGNPLPVPQVADRLMYYGMQPLGYVSYYYNICVNRIEAANQHKFSLWSNYLGWIIPTDRPPCYDDTGSPIYYVCYYREVDFQKDYRQTAESISFYADGQYCYDVFQPETIIWYHNLPYKLIDYENTLLTSRAFTAWCFGVSLTEIDRINEEADILALLPYHTRAIPLPTRTCYLQDPRVLEMHPTIHEVQAGETLASIARQYDRPYQLIAAANDLDVANTIWVGQKIIIPDGIGMRSLYMIAGGSLGFVGVLTLLYWKARRRRKHEQAD